MRLGKSKCHYNLTQFKTIYNKHHIFKMSYHKDIIQELKLCLIRYNKITIIKFKKLGAIKYAYNKITNTRQYL